MSVGSGLSVRREFALPEDDQEFLDGLNLRWELVLDGGVQWLLLYEFPLPPGFNVQSVTMAIRIIPGYPAAALDMVYVSPPLGRVDGKPIPALSLCSIVGSQFQQWSRHYTAVHPWRPNIDSIASHIRAAEEWFKKATS